MTNPNEHDVLPTLVRLTGLTEKQVDAALEELARKGFYPRFCPSLMGYTLHMRGFRKENRMVAGG
jgi:hypothetical protein